MATVEMKEYRKQKRQYKKGWKRATRAPRVLAVVSAILAIILAALLVVVNIFDCTFYILMQSQFYKVNQGAESASMDSEYFKSTFASEEERAQYGAILCRQLEEEGAVLLKNENNALPLPAGSKVSCFSQESVDPVYGGTGSGAVDSSTAVTLKSALEWTGLEVNGSLWDFYLTGEGSQYRRTVASLFGSGQYAIHEVPWDVYTEEALSEVAVYGDAAIVLFGRVGGEGDDLPVYDCEDGEDGNYLSLNAEERELLEQIKKMKDAGTVKRTIVLLNTANAIELDFVDDERYGVDACLWIGDVGATGLRGVANILVGNVNPSGRLVDTLCKDNLSSPAAQNMGSYTYTNADTVELDVGSRGAATKYVVYAEGIYVGYKYYETRYMDTVVGAGNSGDYDYSADVAYPFGYGLSYTTFAFSDYQVNYNEATDCFDISVTVTNTGKEYGGKQVVQIYAESPYTEYDKQYGIEKAAVTLVGFAKTDVLRPGQSQTVQLSVDRRELASYDAYGEKTYILEDGNYSLVVAENAHDAVNNILASRHFTTSNTNHRMDADGNAELVYTYTNDTFDAKTYSVSKNGGTITNRFDNADLNIYDNGAQAITYLSRSDWQGTFPKAVVLELTEAMARDLADQRYDGEGAADVEMPTIGADNGLKLIELRGAAFDDERWDALLDQMTFEEMAWLVGHGFHWSMPAESIDLPGTRDENGPQGLTASLLLGDVTATSFTSEDVMAATWNRDLIAEVGRVIGEDCLNNDVVGLYGPGANNHRTAYSGRNFEYYSEDGFLAGKMCEAEVTAIQNTGTYVQLKHCALNDSETDRSGICTWVNEQAAREIYYKAFQYALEENDTAGIMNSYSRVGCYWNGSHAGMQLGLLREEWGNHGMYISDNTGFNSYMNGIDGTLAGTTIYDSMAAAQYRTFKDTKGTDPVVVAALREACHYNLYTLVNSSAMNGITVYDEIEVTLPTWHMLLYVLTFFFAAAWIGCIVWRVVNSKKYKKTHEKPVKPIQ